ncbi:MAG: hypothetical protein ABMA00_01615 [Gemmatimonas sp.]
MFASEMPELKSEFTMIDVLVGSRDSLRHVLPGLLLAVLTLLFGFGTGVVFGLNEDAIKSRLSASAASVDAAVYKQDAVAVKAVLDKSWTYMQRAHLHAGALGAVAIALTLMLVLLGTRPRVAAALSASLGGGSLGYSVFWMWAGFRAPALGGTSAAKESLAWLAIPSSGLVVGATAVVAVLLVLALLQKRNHA